MKIIYFVQSITLIKYYINIMWNIWVEMRQKSGQIWGKFEIEDSCFRCESKEPKAVANPRVSSLFPESVAPIIIVPICKWKALGLFAKQRPLRKKECRCDLIANMYYIYNFESYFYVIQNTYTLQFLLLFSFEKKTSYDTPWFELETTKSTIFFLEDMWAGYPPIPLSWLPGSKQSNTSLSEE